MAKWRLIQDLLFHRPTFSHAVLGVWNYASCGRHYDTVPSLLLPEPNSTHKTAKIDPHPLLVAHGP